MVLEALVAEAGPVIRSLLEGSGIRKAEIENEFSDEELRNAAIKVAEATAANESSMLQDVKQKRETEVRWINGWVVEEGKKRGMECRWHEEVVSLVENRGQGERRLLGEVLEGRGNDD
jgi:Ketopantoate reductase